MPKKAPGAGTSKLGSSANPAKRSALLPAKLPETESFLQANSSVIGSIDQSAGPIQTAAQRINELNKLELPQLNGTGEDEVFGGDGIEVDYELQNQQNMMTSQNLVSMVSTNRTVQDTEINTDANNFQSTKDKFMQLSEKEMQQNKKLEKSRQEVIAGKILRIRAEI